MITIIVLSFIVLLAIYNAYIIKWGVAYYEPDRSNAGKIWHFVGAVVRALLIICIATYNFSEISYNTIYVIVALFLLNWVVYDIVLNAFRGEFIFYRGSTKTGTTSFIDKLFANDWLYLISKIIALLTGLFLLFMSDCIYYISKFIDLLTGIILLCL